MTKRLDHLSPTSIAQFERCGHQWKLERMDKIPKMVGMPLVGGLAWHDVSKENFLQKIETGNDLEEHELERLFKKFFQKRVDVAILHIPPGTPSLKDLIEETRARLVRLVPAYVEYASTVMPIEGGVEKRFVIPGTDQYPDILCYVDLIDDQRCVHDLKTTKSAWSDDDVAVDTQLSAYGLAYRIEFGQDPAGFSFDFLVATKTTAKAIIKRTQRNASHYITFLRRAAYVWKMHQAEIYPPATKGWWCGAKYCCHTEHCEFFPKLRRV